MTGVSLARGGHAALRAGRAKGRARALESTAQMVVASSLSLSRSSVRSCSSWSSACSCASSHTRSSPDGYVGPQRPAWPSALRQFALRVHGSVSCVDSSVCSHGRLVPAERGVGPQDAPVTRECAGECASASGCSATGEARAAGLTCPAPGAAHMGGPCRSGGE